MKDYERDFLKRHTYGSFFKNISTFKYNFLKLVTFLTSIMIIVLLYISINTQSWFISIDLLLIGVFLACLIYNFLFYPHCYKRDVLPAYEVSGVVYVILYITRKKVLVSSLNKSNFISYKKANKYFDKKFRKNLLKDMGKLYDPNDTINVKNHPKQRVFIGLFKYNDIFVRNYNYISNIYKNNGIFYMRNYRQAYIKYLKKITKTTQRQPSSNLISKEFTKNLHVMIHNISNHKKWV